MIMIDTEQRRVECKLDEEERHERALKAAELSAQAGEEKARAQRMKEEAAALLKQSEARALEAGKLLTYFKDGKEPRDLECRVMFDPTTNKVYVYEGMESFRTLESRAPTEADWPKIKKAKQPDLFRRSPIEQIEKAADDLFEEVMERRASPKGRKAKASEASGAGGVNLTVVKTAEESAPAAP